MRVKRFVTLLLVVLLVLLACTVPPKDDSAITVYVTATGTKYHILSCSYVRLSKIPISLADAKAQGYAPCSVYDPPL